MGRRLLMTLLAGLAAGPAWAQALPVLLPDRDVAVTFRLEGSDQMQGDIQAVWSASRRLLRIDNASLPGWVLVEEASRRASMVMPQGVVMRLPDSPELAAFFRDPGAQGRYTRLGRRSIAGLGCTDWRLERPDGKSGTACLTPDGVLLRLQQTGRREVLQATRVAYGPQPAARFALPAGGAQFNLPPALRGLLQGG